MKLFSPKTALLAALPLLLLNMFLALPATAADVRDITFPVIGATRYSDDFGDPRSGGRTHEGNDIFGMKGQQLVAAADGMVRFVPYPEPYYGYMIILEGEDGYSYHYLHINNDTPGTDDGRGGGMSAYAPDMVGGLPVTEGQLIGWMGDSGNAEGTSPHLHFEIHRTDGNPINPYLSLQAASHITRPVVYPPYPGEVLPYGEFRGGASLALGNLDDDALTQEVVTGAETGGGPHVRIFETGGDLISQFYAYDTSFRGGVDVAAADVDGDGIDDIVVGPGPGMSPEVRVFTRDGNLLLSFSAYPDTFKKGIRVAAADLDGDNIAEIITVPRQGGGPHVRVFRSTGVLLNQFFAYLPGFRGGVDLAATAATDVSSAMIVTGAGPGGGPHVRIFSPQGTVVGQFFPYASGFRGGVRVSIGDVDDDNPGPEILTIPASKGSADIRVTSAAGTLLNRFTQFEEWWRGGFDIAGGTGILRVVSVGGRRTSLRSALDRDTDDFQVQNAPVFLTPPGD